MQTQKPSSFILKLASSSKAARQVSLKTTRGTEETTAARKRDIRPVLRKTEAWILRCFTDLLPGVCVTRHHAQPRPTPSPHTQPGSRSEPPPARPHRGGKKKRRIRKERTL